MKQQKYTCSKCNHGDCVLLVDDDGVGELDMPEWCPYNQSQPTNWKVVK